MAGTNAGIAKTPSAVERASARVPSGQRRIFADAPALKSDPLDSDAHFLDVLTSAGLLRGLDAKTTLAVVISTLSREEDERRIDMLREYYAGQGDPRLAEDRTQEDRFLLCGPGGASTAAEVVAALSALSPDLPELKLERIGSEAHGQLVVSAGDNVRPIIDEEDDEASVSVRAIVHAFNGFLRDTATTSRLVPLVSDGMREVYVGVPLAAAVELFHGGLLEVEETEELVDFGEW